MASPRGLIEKQMIDFIRQKNRVERRELAERFSYLAPRTLREYVRRLGEKGLIKRARIVNVYYSISKI